MNTSALFPNKMETIIKTAENETIFNRSSIILHQLHFLISSKKSKHQPSRHAMKLIDQNSCTITYINIFGIADHSPANKGVVPFYKAPISNLSQTLSSGTKNKSRNTYFAPRPSLTAGQLQYKSLILSNTFLESGRPGGTSIRIRTRTKKWPGSQR